MTNDRQHTHERILEAVHQCILENGFKATTMELVAKRLGMSKRTLYEIFESKTDMIDRAMEHHKQRHEELFDRILRESPNVIVALLEIFRIHQDELRNINISVFRDMDRLYPELREKYEERHRANHQGLAKLYRLGVSQGMFRPDIDIELLITMMEIHGEAVKRMEEHLPDNVSLLDIFSAFSLGFLRGIASRKGLDVLDSLMEKENAASSTGAPSSTATDAHPDRTSSTTE
ncbi:MAG: TetR/AcrR family transcriptional regulator [Bacteroides sp.]|nr:TetR/AcrR family transcriptional regulator [Bacteroides sp.]